MRGFKKIISQLLICFALCIVATLSFAGRTKDVKDVIVVNPDSQPVPVMGTLSVNSANEPGRVPYEACAKFQFQSPQLVY